jgi:hypothetical protein
MVPYYMMDKDRHKDKEQVEQQILDFCQYIHFLL